MEMTPGLSLGITLVAILVALTGLSIYTSFGPPSKKLADPFDDHDD
jgi:PsbN protein